MKSELMKVRHKLAKCERELYNAELYHMTPERVQKILDKKDALELRLSEIQEVMRAEHLRGVSV